MLSPAGIALEPKDIHMSSPDVNTNYIKSFLFHDVCIEIVTVKQSALSLFAFLKFGFMCVYVSIFMYFNFFLSGVWFIVTVVIFVTCTFGTWSNKDQSINQSINQSMETVVTHICWFGFIQIQISCLTW